SNLVSQNNSLSEQLAAERKGEFATRLRAHKLANTNSRYQSHILLLQMKLANSGIEIPPITVTDYTDKVFEKMESGELEDAMLRFESSIKHLTKEMEDETPDTFQKLLEERNREEEG